MRPPLPFGKTRPWLCWWGARALSEEQAAIAISDAENDDAGRRFPVVDIPASYRREVDSLLELPKPPGLPPFVPLGRDGATLRVATSSPRSLDDVAVMTWSKAVFPEIKTIEKRIATRFAVECSLGQSPWFTEDGFGEAMLVLLQAAAESAKHPDMRSDLLSFAARLYEAFSLISGRTSATRTVLETLARLEPETLSTCGSQLANLVPWISPEDGFLVRFAMRWPKLPEGHPVFVADQIGRLRRTYAEGAQLFDGIAHVFAGKRLLVYGCSSLVGAGARAAGSAGTVRIVVPDTLDERIARLRPLRPKLDQGFERAPSDYLASLDKNVAAVIVGATRVAPDGVWAEGGAGRLAVAAHDSHVPYLVFAGPHRFPPGHHRPFPAHRNGPYDFVPWSSIHSIYWR